jgi:hypothetical protein
VATLEYLHRNKLGVTFPKMFRSKIMKTAAGCWLWLGSKNSDGYGSCYRCRPFKGQVLAHRASWILHRGAIPNGLDVLHNCRNGDRADCVCPDHLWLGNHSQNMADKIAKGRTTAGQRGVSRKLSAELMEQVEDLAKYKIFSHAKIARDYHVTRQRVSQVARKLRTQ